MAKSIDWAGVERDYRAGAMSIREIGRWYAISDTAIRKKAKAAGWPAREVCKGPFQEAREQKPVTVEVILPTPIDPQHLIDRSRAIAVRMLDELDAVTAHIGDVEDMIVSAEPDVRRRQALLKAVSLGERAMTLKNISATLKTLNDAGAPDGKKAQRQADAERVAGKFAPRSGPRLVGTTQ